MKKTKKAPDLNKTIIYLGKEVPAQVQVNVWYRVDGWRNVSSQLVMDRAELRLNHGKYDHLIVEERMYYREGYQVLYAKKCKLGDEVTKLGWDKKREIYEVKLGWECSRCKKISGDPIPDRHFDTKRCKNAGAHNEAERLGYVRAVPWYEDPEWKEFERPPDLAACQVRDLEANYKTIMVDGTLYVSKDLYAGLKKYYNAKIELPPRKFKTSLMKFLADNGYPPSKGRIRGNEPGCCVTGCTVLADDSYLTTSGTKYMICPDHMSSFLVCMDKFLEETQGK